MDCCVIEKYTNLSKYVADSRYLNSAYNEYCDASDGNRFDREATQARAESARAKKRGRDNAAGIVNTPSPQGLVYAEKIAGLRDKVSNRLKQGYYHDAGLIDGDERYQVEEVGPSLRLVG